MAKVLSKEIKELLGRNVVAIIERESLERKLRSGKKLRVKHGIDPTGEKIHTGRAVVLRKLRAFQKLGHKAVLIVGDFTAQIGDPSDKLEKRPFLNEAQIKKNLKNYLPQIGKIIDLKKAELHYNSHWLTKLNFREISNLAERFTIQQMLGRRNFKERFQKQQEISLREILYPLMQGYDSVAVRADVELGGTDQLFNLLAGRTVQELYGQKPQDILTTEMLEGTDGRKMSTSWRNVINISDTPRDIFGKVMALRDELIKKYFFLATELSEKEILQILKLPPLESKERLAFELVKLYHGENPARQAREFFEKTFRQKKIPEGMQAFHFSPGMTMRDILKVAKVALSNSEFRRLVKGRAIEFNQKVLTDPNFKPQEEGVVRVGKKKFLKIKPRV